ncbi:hypothetical protein O181_119917 [Austropuccinia psidii MF-1]|uniref:Uncharacterized protein n=1 Tax=Austropuccinia psidii MF-1 TaxID=1389203 RepID=A0A9Q3KI79_9BASI|nr:hypothetical protein [Austropuccinia psidii MF-1]
MVKGSPTLVYLATSLCLEPVTNTEYQYHDQSRKSPYLKLEYPEVPSGVGASGTGNSFPKGPPFYTPRIPPDFGKWSSWTLIRLLPNKKKMAL